MKSYAPPGETDGLTFEEARAALNRLKAAALADLEHPLFDRNHPQHSDFADFDTRLHRIIITAAADARDAREAQELDAALEATADLTPQECLARATKLTLTAGYLNGILPPEERAALTKEIAALHLAATQQEPETSTPDVEETDDA